MRTLHLQLERASLLQIEETSKNFLWKEPGKRRVGVIILPTNIPVNFALVPCSRMDVTYYEVPPEYSSAREYRYTIINGHTVLVDPRTHAIIQIVD